LEHGRELSVVAGEVQHRDAENDVGALGREGHVLYRFHPELRGRQRRGQRGGQSADALDGAGVGVHGGNVVSRLQEVMDVAAAAAARLDHAGAGRYAATEDLVEKVDVDGVERGVEIVDHGSGSSPVIRRASPLTSPRSTT
jgi:hypothetical protein